MTAVGGWWLLAAIVLGLPARDPVLTRLRGGSRFGAALGVRFGESGPGALADAPSASASSVVGLRRLVAAVSGAAPRGLATVAALAAAAVAMLAGVRLPAALALGLVAAILALAGTSLRGQRQRDRSRRQLRAALDLLERELAAGAQEEDALRAAATATHDWGPLLREAAATASRGGDVTAVLARAGPPLAPLAAAWSVRARCGAALAELVGRLERDLSDATARQREIEAALAGPRSSAALLAALPIVGIGLGAAMGAHPLSILLGTSAGSVLLLIGVGLDGLGLLWIRRLVRSGQPP